MPRRKSTNTTTNTAPAPTPPSSTVKAKSHKRTLTTSSATTTPGSRASKRLKESATTGSTPSTAKKSKYFEALDSDDSDGTKNEDDAPTTSADDEEEASNFNTDDGASSAADPSSASPSPSASASDSSSQAVGKKKRQRGRKPTTTAAESGAAGILSTAVQAGKELWRAGVKTGLGPGKAVFIERPKPRGVGGIKYEAGRVHPNTMAFLGDLKKNNDREWLKMHDPDYRTSWNDWSTFVESLTERIAEKDETIPELPPKDLVFRIYRDVRFSSDPTPYKTHFSAAWSRTGRKGPYACYYVQIAPGGRSFVGSGLWMPEAQPLALLRRSIDRKPEVIKRILTDAALRKTILGGIPKDEKKAIKAFASQNAENALKTKPKGYNADNPNIELLRLRNFTIGTKITDEQVTSPHALDTIVDLIGTMTPFVTYLNDVVMPDSTGSSSDSGSADGASEAEEDED